MQIGFYGYKGCIYFQIFVCLNYELDELKEFNLLKCDLFIVILEIIDWYIYSSYCLFVGNYVVCDFLMGDNCFMVEYIEEEKEYFEKYLEQQIVKVDFFNKDIVFLCYVLLIMYVNLFINYLKVVKG